MAKGIMLGLLMQFISAVDYLVVVMSHRSKVRCSELA